jgi:hypothetical protein
MFVFFWDQPIQRSVGHLLPCFESLLQHAE